MLRLTPLFRTLTPFLRPSTRTYPHLTRNFHSLFTPSLRPSCSRLFPESSVPNLTTSTNPCPNLNNITQGIFCPLTQIRGGKRNTYNPSIIVRKRRHGFLARLRSRTGRKILNRRRERGRRILSH